MRRSDSAPASWLLLVSLALLIGLDLLDTVLTATQTELGFQPVMRSGLQSTGMVLLAGGLVGREDGRFVVRPRRGVLVVALAAYGSGLVLQGVGSAPLLGVLLLGSYPVAIPALIAWRDFRRPDRAAEQGEDRRPSVDPRGYAVAVLVGLAVAVPAPFFTTLLMEFGSPDSVPNLIWLALAILGSTGLGYLFPVGAARWGAIVMALQPVGMYAYGWFSGAIHDTSSSTGGDAAVIIVAGFCLILSPFAIYASLAGRSLKERRYPERSPE